MNNSRRLAGMLLTVLCLGALVAGRPAMAAEVAAQAVTLPTAGQPVAATRFAALGTGKRPAVILLHGRQGIEPFAAYYRRQAMAIARAGLDAYLLSYYDEADLARANDPDPAKRQALFRERAPAWAALVRDVVGDILAEPRSSGRVGLVGFSQGGFLAAGAAGLDGRINALVVYYGGIPSVFSEAIRRLPPLLELHGDADAVVAPEQGQALVELAGRLGRPAARTVFPGAGHGFSGPVDQEAQRQTVSFLRKYLLESAD